MPSEKKTDQRKRILVICPHQVGVAPGQRLKYEQYFEYFQMNDIQVSVSPFMTPRFQDIVYRKGYFLEKIFWTIVGYCIRIKDLFRLRQFDGVYIFLWVTPFGTPLFESLFCVLNKKVIYDIDDMVFLAPASQANKMIARFKGKRKMMYLMRKAKQVIVCTPHLEEIAKRYNTNVTDISSTINTEKYLPVNPYSNNKKIVIGWSGSHSTSRYLKILEGVFEKLKERYDFEILVMGDPGFSFKNISATVLPWTERSEIPNLQLLDIGVYPLPMNDQWVLGKSGLKALQYMALGIPTVATAVGANFRVIEDQVSGFLVRTEEEWIEKLSLLMDSPALRKRLGDQARQRVEKYYSLNANKEIYLKILKKALD